MVRRLKIAVIGCCQRGEMVDHCVDYCHSFVDVDMDKINIEIVAGCDVNTNNLERFAQRINKKFGHNVNCYEDYKVML